MPHDPAARLLRGVPAAVLLAVTDTARMFAQIVTAPPPRPRPHPTGRRNPR